MSDQFESIGEDDDWDEVFAQSLIGQTLLVGLAFVTSDDVLIERRQIFGTVESCSRNEGIAIRQDRNGELIIIAPVLDAIEYGDPGIYQMTDDDEIVENPDFTALITVTSPIQN